MTDKEKMTLYGLTRYPFFTDKDLSNKLGLKHSTVTSIRHRLKENGYYRTQRIPMLQGMGCEMLVVIYTNFSPLIPLEERVKITGKTIEVFDEIFYSVGEQDKGFSLSLSSDISTIGRINDIRTQTFGSRGLMEDQYPNMVVFPFDISKVYRFFDFSQLLRSNIDIEISEEELIKEEDLWNRSNVTFSNTEKRVFFMLIKNPESSDYEVAEQMGISRHTVSKLRKEFERSNLIRKINLPNLIKLGYDILAFFHIKFDPRNPPDMDNDEIKVLMGSSNIFTFSRRFELIMMSAYYDYDSYKMDRTRVLQVLKENKWIADHPMIRTYSLNKMIVIKDFKFVPLTKNVIGLEE
jgi:DNA-binding MarR family transcriptional regulator